MAPHVWWTLLGVWTLAVMTPGPDFLTVLARSTGGSRRAGLLAGLGVTAGIAVWAAGSMAGLAVLLERFAWLERTIRWAGAAYLAWLGLAALRSAWRARRDPAPAPVDVPVPPAARAGWRDWSAGLLTNLGNPKAVVFFGALFTTLVPADATASARAGAVAAMVLVAALWFSTVAAVFSSRRVARGYRRARRPVEAVTGGLFVALAGRLALER